MDDVIAMVKLATQTAARINCITSLNLTHWHRCQWRQWWNPFTLTHDTNWNKLGALLMYRMLFAVEVSVTFGSVAIKSKHFRVSEHTVIVIHPPFTIRHLFVYSLVLHFILYLWIAISPYVKPETPPGDHYFLCTIKIV